jgi:gliding motility-associated-like protein
VKVLRNILILLCFSICYGTPKTLKAGHVLGSELTYEYTQNSTIKIHLKVYRDCQECKFNGSGGGTQQENCSDIPPVDVYGVVNGSRQLLTRIQIKTDKIENITNTCNNIKNKCHNSNNPDVGFGFEVHHLSGTLNLTDFEAQGICHFYFASSIFSRSNSIAVQGNPLPKFFNYTELIQCGGIKSNAPELSLHPPFLVNSSNPVYVSPGIMQKDEDSISVRLVEALSDFEQPIPYAQGRNYTTPLTLRCIGAGCLPSPTSNPPAGFFVDPLTGNTVFTPVSSPESGTLVYEITKWKKNHQGQFIAVSKVRRDFLIQSQPHSNAPPVFENFQTAHDACEGIPFTLDIPVKDQQTVSYQLLTSHNNIILSEVTLDHAPFKLGHLSFTPQKSDVNNTLFLNIWVKDNHCPDFGYSSRTLTVKVHPNPSLKSMINVGDCGDIHLDASSVSSNDPNDFFWLVTFPNGVSKEYYGKKHTISHQSGGMLIFRLHQHHTCKTFTADTLHLPVFTKPTFTLKNDFAGCLGKPIPVQIEQLIGNAPFQILWNNTLGNSTQSFTVLKETQLINVKVRDKNGCSEQKETSIHSYPSLQPQASDSLFCANDKTDFVLNHLVSASAERTSFFFERLSSGVNILQQDSFWYFSPTDFTANFARIRYVESDQYLCQYADTFTIRRLSFANVEHVIPPGPFCLQSAPINLYDYFNVHPKDAFFQIQLQGNRVVLQNGILTPSHWGTSGTFDLEMGYYKCMDINRWEIVIQDMPKLEVGDDTPQHTCHQSAPISLKGKELGGFWTGRGVEGYVYNPHVSFQQHIFRDTLVYHFVHPENSCSVYDTAVFIIHELPRYNIKISDQNHEIIPLNPLPNQDIHYICSKRFPLYVEINLTDSNQPFPGNITHHIVSNKGVVNGGIQNQPFTLKMADSDTGIVHLQWISSQDICPEIEPLQAFEFTVLSEPRIEILTHPIYTLCEDDKPIIMEYNAYHADLVTWNMQHITHSIFPAQLHMSFPQKGTYVVEYTAHNKACEINKSLPDTFHIYPNPPLVLKTIPETYIPIDLKQVFMEDVGKYDGEVKRKWTIEGKQYHDMHKLQHEVILSKGLVELKLEVKNQHGCSSEITKFLEISGPLDLYIPNAFSPNSMGHESNNTFKVDSREYQQFEMKIFNRWGEVVFWATNPNLGWDGTFMGQPAPEGTYGYFIKVTNQFGGSREFKGSVMLIR